MQDTIKKSIESILNQTLKNIEIICINNASEDESSQIVQEIAKSEDKIIYIDLPVKNDENEAALKGVDLASGDFIVIYSGKDIIEEDELEKKYYELIKSESDNIKLESGNIYKRSFIDNKSTLNEVIESNVNEYVKKNDLKFNIFEKYIKEEIEKCYRNSVENLNNNNYEIMNRCDSLEKLIFAKTDENLKLQRDMEIKFNDLEEKLKSSYEYKFTELYNYINSEINKKGCEVNKIYDEININYKYTEKINRELKEEISQIIDNSTNNLYQKITELENDILLKYEALQKYTDVSLEKFENKLKVLKSIVKGNQSVTENYSFDDLINVVELEEIMNKNFENIYKHINENNSKFFKELSKIYEEINKKFVENNKATELIIKKNCSRQCSDNEFRDSSR